LILSDPEVGDYCPRCGSTEIGTALIGQYLKIVGKDKHDKSL
jgi:hypothetical protein